MKDDNAEFWQRRAAEVRQLASLMGDPGARATVLSVASGYDRMAEIARWKPTFTTNVKVQHG
jgi:hypothetical protein